MNRREVGRTLLMGAMTFGVPTAAFAQAMASESMGDAERRHAMDTLRVGGLALQSSQVAQRKASGAAVKKFAGFEVDEQTTIAQIIKESTGMAPPPPDAKAKAVMDKLNAASGRAFDTAYITAQTDGHNELLQIQERYLASGRVPAMRHVAMLARGQIKEHLAHLATLRSGGTL